MGVLQSIDDARGYLGARQARWLDSERHVAHVTACPTCKRSSTWSAKWQTCSACGAAQIGTSDTDAFSAIRPIVTEVPERATYFVTIDGDVTKERIVAERGVPIPHPLSKRTGRPKLHENHAARQRAYRERKAKTS